MFRAGATLFAVLVLALAGCRSWRPNGPDDLDSACDDAVERRLEPRTFELLSRMADLVVARERQLAHFEAAGNEYFRVFGAGDDPRFVWAHEVECYVRFAASSDPEPRVREVARRLLEFEQAREWAFLAAMRERPRSDAGFDAALMALRISTGWSEERILGFDFDSLPVPEKEPPPVRPKRSVEACGAELLRATRELLALAAASPAPEKTELEAAQSRVRSARVALAESSLYRAWEGLRSDRDPVALAAWRTARARLELEKSFPGL